MQFLLKTTALAVLCGAIAACSQTPEPATVPAPAVGTSQVQPANGLLQAGQALPWQTLTAIDGKQVSLAPGKRQLLIFFATWCGDSQRAMRQLMASPLVQQADLQIVGIGREEDAAALAQFRSVYQLNFALVADKDRALYKKVADKGIPRLVTVAANGEVRQVILGEVPDVISQLHW